ncbi:MAG: ThuA domain-containing protein [Bryobacterales bacterium]|nr:ThuA domain-containing protein [Bryobacterales bacterium]
MRIRFRYLFLLAAAAAAMLIPAPAQQSAPKKKKLLAIGACKGFHHDAVSHGLATIWKIGQESGLWDTYIKTDTELLTKRKLGGNAKTLDYFDAVLFYTTGEIDLTEEQKKDLLSFVRDDGKGFLGAHSATDTLYKWPEYGEMIGGYFDHHPWNQFQAPVIVEDRTFPATKHFPAEFTIHDEIYQIKEFSRDRVRVLMRLDENRIDLQRKNVNRKDKDFAVTWVREYGKGKVFYSTLGHREDAWDRQDVQKMWLEAVKWAMGMTQGTATPRPRP